MCVSVFFNVEIYSRMLLVYLYAQFLFQTIHPQRFCYDFIIYCSLEGSLDSRQQLLNQDEQTYSRIICEICLYSAVFGLPHCASSECVSWDWFTKRHRNFTLLFGLTDLWLEKLKNLQTESSMFWSQIVYAKFVSRAFSHVSVLMDVSSFWSESKKTEVCFDCAL